MLDTELRLADEPLPRELRHQIGVRGAHARGEPQPLRLTVSVSKRMSMIISMSVCMRIRASTSIRMSIRIPVKQTYEWTRKCKGKREHTRGEPQPLRSKVGVSKWMSMHVYE